MWSRRNNRSTHGTAYTGVNRTSASSANQQPDSGALAAALTIGNALKQQNTGGNSAPKTKQQQSNISRSTSFQYKPASSTKQPQKPQQQPHQQQQPHSNSISSTGSLLKRGSRSSIQTNPQQSSQVLHAPRTFSTSSRGSSNSSRHNSPLTSSDSVAHQHHTQVYDIDDSFNDSYLDEITEETTQTYLKNKANMKDLRLPKQTRGQTSTYKTTSSTPKAKKSPVSAQSQNTLNAPVKMVKKYVPSPTGIKIIEVPEAQFQKEVARSNSMRTSSLMSRSNSLRNVSLNKKNGIPRSSSLSGVSRQLKQPQPKATPVTRSASSPLKSMHEEVALEESLGHSDDLHEQELKYRALEKEIEEEKKLAAQIELKRKEYEQLKKTRLENEQKLKDLEDEVDHNNSITTESTVIHHHPTQEEWHGIIEEHSESEEDVPIVKVPPIVDELEKKNVHAVQVTKALEDDVSSSYSDTTEGLPVKEKKDVHIPDGVAVSPDHVTGSDIPTSVEHDTNDESVTVTVPVAVTQETETEKIVKPVLSTFDEDTTGEDFAIPEDDQQHNDALSPDAIDKDGYSSVSEDERELNSLDPGLISEIGVINQYHNLNSSELLHDENVSFEDIHDDGIEEVEDSDFEGEDGGKSHLAKELRPKFETTPEIIEPTPEIIEPTPEIIEPTDIAEEIKDEEELSKPESEDTMIPPASASKTSSSKSSVYSVESPAKKPMKSAMKSTSSFSTPAQGSQPPPINSALAKSNAAQQAYLSLTTAENTRLNSKLSNSNIAPNPDFALSTNGPAGAYPQFATAHNNNNNNNNNNINNNNLVNRRLSQKTLRKPPQGQKNGLQGSQRPFSTQQMPTSMSSRSLRPNSYVQPIQPHPALQPGYQSPSKMKAAALYAKAQARPVSQFKPPANRSSSYSRNDQHQGQPQHPQPQHLNVLPPPANGAARDHDVPPRSPNRMEPKRTTLRSPPPQSSSQNTIQSQQNGINNGQSQQQKGSQSVPLKSRFNDSDDDLTGGFNGGISRSNFKSRFNDSDDDISNVHVASKVQVTSLRAQNQASTTSSSSDSPKKEKKFKKLRKLFGGSKD